MKHEGFTPGPRHKWSGGNTCTVCGLKRIHGEGCTGYETISREWHDSSPPCISVSPVLSDDEIRAAVAVTPCLRCDALLAENERLRALLSRSLALLDTIDPVKKSHSRDAFREEIRAALAGGKGEK